jgi:UDPglucose 6-dehydrogenase
MRIVEAVLHSNECRKRAMVKKVAAALGKPLRDKTVAVLGLTFKANTDDMREAPSITLIAALIDAGARVRAFDPAGMEVARTVLPLEVVYAGSAYEAADKADAVVLMTEWPEFRRLDLGRVARRLNTPVVVDLRNFYEPQDVTIRGLDYYGIGRAPRRPTRQASRKNGEVRPVRNGHQNGKPAATQLSQRAAKWARREEPDDKKDVGRRVVMEIGRSS